MGVNSIRADKLSAIVSFLDGFYCSSRLIVLFNDIYFSPTFLKVKSMKTAQMFFEDYVAPS